jgi:Domain of unknown function (DUF3291)
MPFVSITRLRLRSALYLIPFFIHATRSSNQMVRDAHFLKGKTLLDKRLTFWTMSLWKDEAGMRAYRNSKAHKKAMPKLQYWCNEASIVHWTQEGDDYPGWLECYERMKTTGRISKVRHPSPDHANLQVPPPRESSKTERILLPKH